MKEKRKYSESIFNSMKTLIKGEVQFIEKINNWSVEFLVSWNRKRIIIFVKSRKSDLEFDFVSCALTRALFLSFLTRTDSFNFSGKKSRYSELILESSAVQSLMNSRNASIKLEGKYMVFRGGIRKKDKTSLSNIFTLYEMIMNEIDDLNTKNST